MANPLARVSQALGMALAQPFIGCRLYRSAALSLNTSTATKIIWDAQNWDPFNMHDPVINPTRITPGRAGKWRVEVQLSFAANSTNHRYSAIYLNTVNKTFNIVIHSSSQPVYACIRDVIETKTGLDYIEIEGWQNSGGALGLTVGSPETFVNVEYAGR